MSNDIMIDGNSLSIHQVVEVSSGKRKVSLHPDAKKRLERRREQIESLGHNRPHYGINTGFGALSETLISPDQLDQLQYNLIVSHAV